MTDWEKLLRSEGARIRATGDVSPASLDRIWARCALEINAEPAKLLGSFMEPICGLGTVERTLALAKLHSQGSFQDLLEHWSAALASICGSATGDLMLSVGTRIAAG